MNFEEESSPITFNIGTLTEQSKIISNDLLKKYRNIFSSNLSKDGQIAITQQTDLIEHTISTGDAKPLKQQAYKASRDDNEFIQKEIDAMLEKKIIRESTSDWSSPAILVSKKNSKKRMVFDFRKLNAVTQKDNYPLPLIKELFKHFKDAKYFSTIDLASGYYQIRVAEKDKRKTAFITKYGLYEFNAMPFGLCNAPATFQRLMNTVLKEHISKICVVYLDDITVYSKTFEQHLKDLEIIFKTLKEAKLQMNQEKCFFFQEQVLFLGHKISKNSIEPDDDKIKKIKDYQPPDLKAIMILSRINRIL